MKQQQKRILFESNLKALKIQYNCAICSEVSIKKWLILWSLEPFLGFQSAFFQLEFWIVHNLFISLKSIAQKIIGYQGKHYFLRSANECVRCFVSKILKQYFYAFKFFWSTIYHAVDLIDFNALVKHSINLNIFESFAVI